MARADLLIKLVKAGSQSDHALFQQTVEALIADERGKQHHVLADQLAANLKSNGSTSASLPRINGQIENLLYETTPRVSLKDLLLTDDVIQSCNELIEEHHRCDLLRSYNLEPRNRILLAGPPGNGKTSLAEALANELMVPFLVVRYEGVIGSYLGETAVRLKKIFENVRSRHCVLFFDEFDTVGKERGDIHETGEIKRVVSSLLLQMDALPSYVIVITASNHPELLDRAVWRRFQIRLQLSPPTNIQIEEYFKRFENRLGEPLGLSAKTFTNKIKGLSFAEIESFCCDLQRRYVLALPDANITKIVSSCINQWDKRFVLQKKNKR